MTGIVLSQVRAHDKIISGKAAGSSREASRMLTRRVDEEDSDDGLGDEV